MSPENESRPTPDGQKSIALEQNNNNPDSNGSQANLNTTDIFQELAALPRWVPYHMVFNPDRQKFDKIPTNGSRKLSTKAPTDWDTLLMAASRAKENNLPGVGFVVTGGVRIEGWRLMGLDFDDVDLESFALPFSGYAETSPSGAGVRSFAWVPEDWAVLYKDTVDALYPNCSHVEIYLGTSPRFLTVTFQGISLKPIPYLEGDALVPFSSRLKPAEAPIKPLSTMSATPGTPLDQTDFKLTPEQWEVVNGQGQHDRSSVLHGLIIKLIDAGASREDILATMLTTPALWEYCLSHRHNDADKAREFARQELARAYAHTRKAQRERLSGFNEAWTQKHADTQGNTQGDESPITADDYFEDIGAEDAKPISWLVNKYFEDDTTSVIFGPTGCYKTFVAVDVAFSVATGQAWHGHKVVRPGWVVYLAGEGRNNIRRRIKGICLKRGFDMKTLKIKLFKVPADLTNEKTAAMLKAALESLPEAPVLIVVDTLHKYFLSGNENSNEDMGRFTGHIDLVRGNAAVMVVHHSGHDHPDRPRGASSLPCDVGALYQVERKDSQNVTKLTPKKMKDAILPPPLYLQVKVVELPFMEEDGTTATTVVLEDSEDQAATQVEQFYKDFPDLVRGERKNYLPKLLEKIHDNPAADQRKLADSIGISQSTVNRTIQALTATGYIKDDKLTLEGLELTALLLRKTRPQLKAEIMMPPPPGDAPRNIDSYMTNHLNQG